MTSNKCKVNDDGDRDYVDIQDHGLIGNLHTAALISIDGSVESYCVPDFDSPSVFARILDKDKGGHFSVMPQDLKGFQSKQAYLPSSNILSTKFLGADGVMNVTDFLPRRKISPEVKNVNHPLTNWLIRRVEIIRGRVPLRMECAPAFNYARDEHTMEILDDESKSVGAKPQKKVVFTSKNLTLDLRYILDYAKPDQPPEHSQAAHPVPQDEERCHADFKELDLRAKGHKGVSACLEITLEEGNAIWFILRDVPVTPKSHPPPRKLSQLTEQALSEGVDVSVAIRGAAALRPDNDPVLTTSLCNSLYEDTNKYWVTWINKSTYKGRWREAVHRSALALKLLTYEPTGAVVASPTFSLPEFIGGTRNWDYRYTWIRDASFTLYALIRLGFTDEANAYMGFIFSRLAERVYGTPSALLNSPSSTLIPTVTIEQGWLTQHYVHYSRQEGSR
ncbi:hypothetical protein FRB95_001007 [Tulasnella sp. JGI-2019a]|nr:hypothetical protein FRB95_001007 [Tulasnella sp. JGI-2019a]